MVNLLLQVEIGGYTIDDHSISTTGVEINDSTQQIFISSSAFKVDHFGNVTASNVDLSGKITATSGEIGGYTIDDHSISTTGVEINDSSQNIFISSSAFKVDHTGNVTASNVDLSGKITAQTGEIGGFTIGTDLANSAGGSDALRLKGATGQITASNAQITGKITATSGQIAGFTVSGDTLTATNFTLDAANRTISIGTGNNIFVADGDVGIHLGNSAFASAPFSVTKAGVLKAQSGTVGGFTLSSDDLTATNFTLSPSGKSITLGSGTDIFVVDGDVGLQLGHGTFASAPFSVTKAGVLKATSGTVGGWTLGSDTIVGSNLTLRSSGVIETNDFATGVKGFRLDSANNGSAEFENVKIRGTLSTAVFEKETVNAVGGQLYVANSTALTGSLAISASATTMSVVNVTGFTGSYNNDGEILVAKKISPTGFSTEYILVQSASRDEPSSNTNFAGKLFVVRGYRSGSAGDNSFLGDLSSVSQSYAPGQVFASTGRIGTGYIRLNANPSDTTTPYIDIVERTGSGVYDVDLKARLGDLSGLSTTRLHGTDPAAAGFGLYSQNVFLEGGIVANTGSIGGIEMESGKLYNGVGTHGNSNTGFYVDSGSKFSLGDKLVWDGSTLTVEGAINILGGGAVADQLAALNAETGSLQSSIDTGLASVSSSVSGAFNSTSASLASTITSVEANVSGAFTAVSESIAEKLITDSKGLLLDIPAAPSGEGLFLNYPYMGFYDNSEFTAFISASGGFQFKADNDNLISFGQTVVDGDGIESKSFILRSNNVFLH